MLESQDLATNAALKFARSLLLQRGGVGEADLEKIRQAGFSDGAIVEGIGWSPSA